MLKDLVGRKERLLEDQRKKIDFIEKREKEYSFLDKHKRDASTILSGRLTTLRNFLKGIRPNSNEIDPLLSKIEENPANCSKLTEGILRDLNEKQRQTIQGLVSGVEREFIHLKDIEEELIKFGVNDVSLKKTIAARLSEVAPPDMLEVLGGFGHVQH